MKWIYSTTTIIFISSSCVCAGVHARAWVRAWTRECLDVLARACTLLRFHLPNADSQASGKQVWRGTCSYLGSREKAAAEQQPSPYLRRCSRPGHCRTSSSEKHRLSRSPGRLAPCSLAGAGPTCGREFGAVGAAPERVSDIHPARCGPTGWGDPLCSQPWLPAQQGSRARRLLLSGPCVAWEGQECLLLLLRATASRRRGDLRATKTQSCCAAPSWRIFYLVHCLPGSNTAARTTLSPWGWSESSLLSSHGMTTSHSRHWIVWLSFGGQLCAVHCVQQSPQPSQVLWLPLLQNRGADFSICREMSICVLKYWTRDVET